MRVVTSLLLFLCIPLFLLAEEPRIRILSHDRPPFHYKDSSGNIVGICVDIVDTIFKEMDLEYDISDQKWARVWDKIKKGDAEATFTTSRKKNRMPYLYYPKTDMWISNFVFFVLKENKELAPNGSYEEIAKSGQDVAVWRGASYNEQFWITFPNRDGSTSYDPSNYDQDKRNKQLIVVSDPERILKMLGRKRFTFSLQDRIVGQYLINKNNITDKVINYEQPVFSKGYPMPFIINSDYPNLKEISIEFEKRLIIMKQDGRYEAIVNKWLTKTQH
ncbi:MAG: amino acid ABC transporter substrate-binding protein [Psychromonas sp.]|nr:amino acid ABC transporter substrate-binding protein [Alteromonadales bacterium]MCP5077340.1 amino acid ABC transporter substrate-binding protein [Psychromonas sp.]